jgi:hypothetical protein
MATLAQKIAVEQAARQMLARGGLPQPDEVEYGHTCIRLFWRESRSVVIIQIDEPPPGWLFAEQLSQSEREELLRDSDQELAPEEMPFERFRVSEN